MSRQYDKAYIKMPSLLITRNTIIAESISEPSQETVQNFK